MNMFTSAESLRIRSECHGQNANVFRGQGFGVGASIFLYFGFGQWHFPIGVLSQDGVLTA